MFTGIVEELGRVRARSQHRSIWCFEFTAEVVMEGIVEGASVAVNGCCLTVVRHDKASFSIEATEETLARTNLGALRVGDQVNLERAAKLGDRLGGHLVQGHVDAVGTVLEPAPHLCVSVPAHLSRYLAEKGSVALDGCSMTIVSAGEGQVRAEVIPHTARSTTLGRKGPGQLVNLEVDVVAKYVESLVRAGTLSPYDRVGGGL
jgi:riboflavin synthase